MKGKTIFLFIIAVVLMISGVVLLAIAQPNETPPDDVTPQFGEGCCCGTSIGIVCIGATTFLLYKKKKKK